MDRNTLPKTAPNSTAEYLTTGETAARLRVSEETIRRWCRAGRLPSVQIGRAHRIPLAAVIACTAGAHSEPDRASSASAAGTAGRGETPRTPTAFGQEAEPRAAAALPARPASHPAPLRDEPGGTPPEPPTAYRQEGESRTAAAPPARAASHPAPLRDEPGGDAPRTPNERAQPVRAYRQEGESRAAAALRQDPPPATPRAGEPPEGRARRPATYTRKPTIIG